MISERTAIITRRIGVGMLCTAYLTITSGFLLPGVIINCCGQLFLLPFAIRHRAPDLCLLSAFYLVINARLLIGML